MQGFFYLRLYNGSQAFSDVVSSVTVRPHSTPEICPHKHGSQQGVAVIPSARSEQHMQENLACCERKLASLCLSWRRGLGFTGTTPKVRF